MTITPKQHELELFDSTSVDFEEVTKNLLYEEALIIPESNGSPENFDLIVRPERKKRVFKCE